MLPAAQRIGQVSGLQAPTSGGDTGRPGPDAPTRTPSRPRRARWLVAPLLAVSAMLAGGVCHAAAPALFGYQETRQVDIALFKQWLDALERHIQLDVPEADCAEIRFNACHLREWYAFIDSIRAEPLATQLQRINDYANRKRYVLDLDNYGVPDYWAVAREFLYNGGDCEDYAITKLFSLRWLGIETERLRIVVLQDTNLRIPHAVLAVYADGDIFILDNQIRQVVKHRDIVHYVPVYSINEAHWWIHTPFL
jgi:predicted transglutaminase-like cysteine proteinase